jgi:hypothetical protein
VHWESDLTGGSDEFRDIRILFVLAT